MTKTPDMSVEIARRTPACWMRIRRYLRELYDQPKVALSLKTRMVKAEVIEVALIAMQGHQTKQRHKTQGTGHKTHDMMSLDDTSVCNIGSRIGWVSMKEVSCNSHMGGCRTVYIVTSSNYGVEIQNRI